MSQNNLIAGSVIIAFVIYVTVRNQLPKYLEALKVW